MAACDKQKVRYRARIVRRMAILMLSDFASGQTASLFAHEAEFTAELRSSFCLLGWPWSIADQAARDLVGQALRRINAQRPSWAEGQREWTVQAGTLIERTRCAKCHAKLPEGHTKFCTRMCATTYHDRLVAIRRSDRDLISRLAVGWI